MSPEIQESATSTPDVSSNTVHLHRILATTPEKIYRAFLTADALAKWLPPFGFSCHVDHLDATVGGTFKMSFTNFTTGSANSFGGSYLELVPNERLHYTDVFDDPNMPGEMHVVVTMQPVMVGTELRIEQSNIPSMIPLEACYLGWQQSLTQLAMLVEPDISE
jgi:uncharacterized protein YndB with AHSA1/START domain